MMIDNIIYILIGIYAIRTLYFFVGSELEVRKILPKVLKGQEKMISIVVPARNEEARIEDCIRSIALNNYPNDKFEIIAVNDRSEDETGQLLEVLSREIPNLIVIHNDNKKAIRNLQGKPGALQLAINSCRGEVILMTDADCIVSKNWIRCHSAAFSDSAIGLTAAYTDIRGDNPFSKIQAVEWLYLHTMAIAGMGFGQPLSCYGNNISLSKDKFDDIGGYEAIKFSITEDLAMLQAMHRHGHSVRHLSNTDSMIRTWANKNLKEYLSQHHRWIVGAAGLGWKAGYFILSTLAIWASIVLSIVYSDFSMLALAISARFAFDMALIVPTMFRLKRKDLRGWVFPSILFMMIFELIAPLFLLKRDVRWKGQVFTEDETKLN